MSKSGRRVSFPKYVINRRKENMSQQTMSMDKQQGLEECAAGMSALIVNQISDSQTRINEMFSEIAQLRNKVQKKKMGFKSKLQTKKNEIVARHHDLIASIQSKTSIQLAENESIAHEIAALTEEIQELSKSVVVTDPEPVRVDLSAKTERILKIRADNMRAKCCEEFKPLFERLEREHEDAIAAIYSQFQQDCHDVEAEFQQKINEFGPTAYVTKEELLLRQGYETIMLKEKMAFEQSRDKLRDKIKRIETERDREMQRITNNTDDAIFQGEQMLAERVDELRDSILEPEQEEVPFEFEFGLEREQQYREVIDAKLKAKFDEQLAEAVDEVAERRDRMERETILFFQRKSVQEEEQGRRDIEQTQREMEWIEAEIDKAHGVVNSMKAEWTDMNQSRRDNEEMIVSLEKQNEMVRERLGRVSRELQSLVDAQIDDDNETDAIQREVDALQSNVISEKRRHIRWIKRAEESHQASVAQIQQRVAMLTSGKDDLIVSLKGKVSDAKRRLKRVQQELQAKAGHYRM